MLVLKHKGLLLFLEVFVLFFFFFSTTSVMATANKNKNNNNNKNNKHSLTYFDLPGRGETIRICLHIAQADWHDHRLPFDEWKSLKPTTPLGSLPILTINGIPHVQSVALARYAGTLAGWYPTDNPLQALIVDEVSETLNELPSKAPSSSDPQEMKVLRQEYQETTMTQYANFVEGIILRNGGVGVIPLPSIADLALTFVVDGVASGNWDHVDPNFFDKYPGIMATVKMVQEHDQVTVYYKATKKKVGEEANTQIIRETSKE